MELGFSTEALGCLTETTPLVAAEAGATYNKYACGYLDFHFHTVGDTREIDQ